MTFPISEVRTSDHTESPLTDDPCDRHCDNKRFASSKSLLLTQPCKDTTGAPLMDEDFDQLGNLRCREMKAARKKQSQEPNPAQAFSTLFRINVE